jgi:N-glycosylase/DNA lyase
MYQIICTKNNNVMVRINYFNPLHTFSCGQCFRWSQDREGNWEGIAYGKHMKLGQEGNIFTFYNTNEQEFIEKWARYFDLDADYENITQILSEKDEHLEKAVAFGSGLRLLRQELWEVMLSFIISQNNNIPRIKQIIESLSFHFGKALDGSCIRYSFPDAAALAYASVDNLNLCRGGYRCRYIQSTARKLLDMPTLLDDMEKMPKEKARELLLSFTGIGKKVSDCILLYSGIDRTAFPVDRWVKRVMEELYLGNETDENTIREFAADYFGDLAGIAQQYLFYYAREHKIGL